MSGVNNGIAVSTARAFDGTKSMIFDMPSCSWSDGQGGGCGAGYGEASPGIGNRSEFYMRHYAYWAPGYTWSAVADKHIAFLDSAGSRAPWAWHTIWGGREPEHAYEPTQTVHLQNVGGSPVIWQTGRWYCLEIHLKQGSGNAILEGWIDGVKRWNYTNATFPNSWQALMVSGYWNTSNSPGSRGAQQRYFDNIVMSTQPIGCLGSTPPPPTPTPPPPAYSAFSPYSSFYPAFYPSFSPSTPPPPAGTITISPSTISFTGMVGAARPASRNVTITTGNGASWASQDTCSFFDANPTSGSSGGSHTLTPSAGWDSLAQGTYTCPMTYSASGNNNLVVQVSAVKTTGTTPPPASTKFLINDRVRVINSSLNVRSTPSTSGTILGSQAVGVQGTVIGGPTAANGFNWWNVNFDSGVDGWSVEDNLQKVTTTPPPAYSSFYPAFSPSTPPPSTAGTEQRCGELGASCICSEPLNSPTYTNNGASWKPTTNLSTKACSAELSGYPIARNSQVSGTNLADSLLSKLPSGHKVSYALWGGDNNTGIFWIGNSAAASSDCGPGFERCEIRWYVYKSSNFMPTGKVSGVNQCSGDKHAEVSYSGGPDSVINPSQEVTGDGMAMYNFLPGSGWTPGVDCCGGGPMATGDTNITGAEQRGKWWRFSHVVRHPSGGTGANKLIIEIYAKNVTDNKPEVKILDLSGGNGYPNWAGPYNTIIPPGRVKTIAVTAYREGSCAGFEAYSHFMVAHWPTDAGQRIGAAYEVEGSGTTPPPPAYTSFYPAFSPYSAFSPYTAFSPSTIRPGDLNADGSVNALDLQLEVNVMLGTESNSAIRARADLNGDGVTNALDLQRIVNLVLGL